MKIKPVRDYDTWINFNFSWNDYRWNAEEKKKVIKDIYDFKIRFAWNPLIVIEQLFINAWGKDFMRVYNLAKKNPSQLNADEEDKLYYAMQVARDFLQALSDAKEEPLVIYMSKRRDK